MHCYRTRFKAERASGYHLFFRAAIAGSVLVVVAYTATFLGALILPQVSRLWACLIPFKYSGTAALSALLGVILPPIINNFYGEEESARQAAKEEGDLIELLIAESIERQVDVELSLRSGKSYVGLALNSGLGTRGESDISLIPMASGYRTRRPTHWNSRRYMHPSLTSGLRRTRIQSEMLRPRKRLPKILGSSSQNRKSCRYVCSILMHTNSFKTAVIPYDPQRHTMYQGLRPDAG